MEIIKSIFGEQLERDSSWQQHLGVRHRLPGGAALALPTTTQPPPTQLLQYPKGPPAPAGALAGPSMPVSVFPDTPRRLSDARRLIKGMICETPSFYSINQRHKAVKAIKWKYSCWFFFCCAPDRLSHIKGMTGWSISKRRQLEKVGKAPDIC